MIGIDFGNSFSTLSTLNKNGNPEMLRDENGQEKIPTVLFWGKDEILAGQAAADKIQDATLLPADEREEILGRIIQGFKRDLAPDGILALPDGSFLSHKEILTAFFSYLKKTAEEQYIHQNAKEAVLTHPATFTECQKQLLETSARNAGFEEIHLLAEPVAAALGYAASGADIGNGLLVYDLGGGTFDLTYLERDGNGDFHFPIEPMGDSTCGGDAFDYRLYDYADMALEKQQGCHFSDSQDSINLAFLSVCRQVKEKLSRNSEVMMKYFLEKQHSTFAMMLTRSEFEKIIDEKIEQTLLLTGKMMNVLLARGKSVDTVLLIGGSSRIPLIGESLHQLLGIKPIKTTYGDTAVALGAAFMAGRLHTTSISAAIASVSATPGAPQAEAIPEEKTYAPPSAVTPGAPQAEAIPEEKTHADSASSCMVTFVIDPLKPILPIPVFKPKEDFPISEASHHVWDKAKNFLKPILPESWRSAAFNVYCDEALLFSFDISKGITTSLPLPPGPHTLKTERIDSKIKPIEKLFSHAQTFTIPEISKLHLTGNISSMTGKLTFSLE